MHLRQRLSPTALLAHLPRRTVRLRLTMVYGSLFLASGALLLVVTDVLWGRATQGNRAVPPSAVPAIAKTLFGSGSGRRSGSRLFNPSSHVTLTQLGVTASQSRDVGTQLLNLQSSQHASDLHQLLLYSAIAIVVMALLAVGLGWLMAGRVLRPLRTITATARDISDSNLHERLRLSGPSDEFKELGDTFDGLLERLEASFGAQRQFVANASHELRTPMATMRASLDVAMAKPGPLPPSLGNLAERLGQELNHLDRLLDSLLWLARAQRELDNDTSVALDDLVSSALERHLADITALGLDVEFDTYADAPICGNETLLSRLVENLVDNAIRHNVAGGWIRCATTVENGGVRLTVENGGPKLDPGRVAELKEPFRRLGPERTGTDTGSGLGLSIVAAVAAAHGGTLELQAREGGGLEVAAVLPVLVPDLVDAPA